jgi:hypothetical protein
MLWRAVAVISATARAHHVLAPVGEMSRSTPCSTLLIRCSFLAASSVPQTNRLLYSDNLDILRRYIKDEPMDLD